MKTWSGNCAADDLQLPDFTWTENHPKHFMPLSIDWLAIKGNAFCGSGIMIAILSEPQVRREAKASEPIWQLA